MFNKKYFKYLISLPLIVLIVYGYLWIKSFDFGKTNPEIAINERNLFFLETERFPSLVENILDDNEIWKNLKAIPEINETDSILKQLRLLTVQNEQLRQIFKGRVLIALNKVSNNKTALVLVGQQKTRMKENAVITSLMSTDKVEAVNKRKIGGTNVYDVQFKEDTGIKNISYSFRKGLFICSFSSSQVEETLVSIGNVEKPPPVIKYQRLRLTAAGNVIANAYFDFIKLDMLCHLFTTKQEANLSLFAASAVYDLEFGKDFISFNGFIAENDSINDGVKIFSGESPLEMKLPNVIPASAILFLQLHFSDILRFFERQSPSAQWKPNIEKTEKINSAYSIDLIEFFKKTGTGEFGLVISRFKNKPSHFFIMEARSGSNAEDHLKHWLNIWASSNKVKLTDYKYFRRIDNQSGIDIFHLPLGGIPAMVFGKVFNNIKGDFFAVHDNYIIFGNSADEVGEYVYQLVLGRNIAQGDGYKKISNNILSRSNLFLYFNPYKTADLFSSRMNNEIADKYRKYSDYLKKFSALTFQLHSADGLYYSKAFVDFSESSNEHVNTVWQSKLDTSVIIKPALVTNHNNGEKEIMVQDAKSQLYLLSSAGRILWKIPLEAPILSEIYQIDFYRNGKFQYLFNTKDKIYLIDRNGNPVEKYPVLLRSSATNGISLFDYDRNGTIRICVACENREIYMYDREGKILPGWKTTLTDHIIKKPLQHFRVEKRDYIVASDKYKTYIYDRRGSIRVKLLKQYPVSENNPFYLDISKGKDKSRLVNSDTLGNILYIYLSGNTVSDKRENPDNTHFFVLSDLDGNNKFEYIFAYGNKLKVLDESGTLIYYREFDDIISHKPVIYEFSAKDRKIGLTVEGEEKIYLINSDGSIYPGFPLKGSSMFSIGSFPGLRGRFNLLVGNRDNFLYNYSVQ